MNTDDADNFAAQCEEADLYWAGKALRKNRGLKAQAINGRPTDAANAFAADPTWSSLFDLQQAARGFAYEADEFVDEFVAACRQGEPAPGPDRDAFLADPDKFRAESQRRIEGARPDDVPF